MLSLNLMRHSNPKYTILQKCFTEMLKANKTKPLVFNTALDALVGITNHLPPSSHKSCVICIIHYFNHKIFIEDLVCDKVILGIVHPAGSKVKFKTLDSLYF